MARGRFASTGVVVGQTPRTRLEQRLGSLKGNRVTMGVGIPRQTEGAVGDITVREISSVGLIAYIKTNSGWYDINTLHAPIKTSWVDMSLENSWVHNTDYVIPQYSKDSNGFVHFRGTAKNGTSASADITTLPVSFRPPLPVVVAGANLEVGNWDVGACAIEINEDGEVSAKTGGSTSAQFLDGVSFFAGQTVKQAGGGTTVDFGGGAIDPPSYGGGGP